MIFQLILAVLFLIIFLKAPLIQLRGGIGVLLLLLSVLCLVSKAMAIIVTVGIVLLIIIAIGTNESK